MDLNSTNMMNAALWYASQGFQVIPLQPNSKVPLPGSNWRQQASADSSAIQAWFASDPRINIGVATGEVSGISVLDVDQKAGEDGLASLQAMGPVPATVACQLTPSGGRHYLFAYEPGLKNFTKRGDHGGLDCRSEGGYILVAPASIGGKFYSWSGDWPSRASIPEMPEALSQQMHTWSLEVHEASTSDMPEVMHESELPDLGALALVPRVAEYLATGETAAFDNDESKAVHIAAFHLMKALGDASVVFSILAHNTYASACAARHRAADDWETWLWKYGCSKAIALAPCLKAEDAFEGCFRPIEPMTAPEQSDDDILDDFLGECADIVRAERAGLADKEMADRSAHEMTAVEAFASLTAKPAPQSVPLPSLPPPSTEGMCADEAFWVRNSVRDLICSEPKETETLVTGLIPKGGPVGLVGPPGSGKSMFALAVGVAIATGTNVLGNPEWQTSKGRVLVVDAEDTREGAQRRLHALSKADPAMWKALGEDSSDLAYHYTGGDDVRLTDQYGGEAPFAQKLITLLNASKTQVQAVILGPLINFTGGDESNESIQSVMRVLARIQKATGTTPIVAHHSAKDASVHTRRDAYAARGGGAFTAAVRAQIHIQGMGQKESGEWGVDPSAADNYVGISLPKANDIRPQNRPTWMRRIPGGAAYWMVQEQPTHTPPKGGPKSGPKGRKTKEDAPELETITDTVVAEVNLSTAPIPTKAMVARIKEVLPGCLPLQVGGAIRAAVEHKRIDSWDTAAGLVLAEGNQGQRDPPEVARAPPGSAGECVTDEDRKETEKAELQEKPDG